MMEIVILGDVWTVTFFYFPYELLVIVACENMTVVGLVIGNN